MYNISFYSFCWGACYKGHPATDVEEVTERLSEKCPKCRIKNLDIFCLPCICRVYH